MSNDSLLNSLLNSWETSPHPSVKITSYFPAYVEMFGHLVGKKCIFIETGILDGGSLFMWRKWLGPDARIIGIDLNPEAEKWKKEGFEIYIGDQGDPKFWTETFEAIGPFDALLDDGGHQSFQQIVTTVQAIKSATKNCVIAVEDTATSFMKDFANHGKHNFLQYCKDATDVLTGRSVGIYKNRLPAVLNSSILEEYQNVYSIQFYSGIVAFHVNQRYAEKPNLVRNKPSDSASDFRYEGRESALVNWPKVFNSLGSYVVVKGGFTRVNRIKNRLKLLKNFLR